MNQFVTVLLVLALFVAIFLFCREIVCWYWKINKRLEIEQQILDELRKLNADKTSEPTK